MFFVLFFVSFFWPKGACFVFWPKGVCFVFFFCSSTAACVRVFGFERFLFNNNSCSFFGQKFLFFCNESGVV